MFLPCMTALSDRQKLSGKIRSLQMYEENMLGTSGVTRKGADKTSAAPLSEKIFLATPLLGPWLRRVCRYFCHHARGVVRRVSTEAAYLPVSLTLTTASVIGRWKGVLPGRPAQRVPVLERRASRRRQGMRRRSPAVHGVLDAPHDQVEQGIDGAAHVVSRGRARLEVREAVLLGLGPGAGLTHGAALLQVRLVAAQHHVRVLAVRVRAELLQPRPDAARRDEGHHIAR